MSAPSQANHHLASLANHLPHRLTVLNPARLLCPAKCQVYLELQVSQANLPSLLPNLPRRLHRVNVFVTKLLLCLASQANHHLASLVNHLQPLLTVLNPVLLLCPARCQVCPELQVSRGLRNLPSLLPNLPSRLRRVNASVPRPLLK